MPKPPFTLTPSILSLTAALARLTGRFEGLGRPPVSPKLRRQNRIRTVHATAAIEGNRLDEEQVTAVLDGKRTVGPAKDILEVQNAVRAYELAPGLLPFKVKSLLEAHRVLMGGLTNDAGRWRSTNVGVLRGSRVAHVAPKAERVGGLVTDLLASARTDAETPMVIRSCVVHYELEFIHPFSDGNGRTGRLWQHVMLLQESPVFEHVPFESVIRERQAAYYDALSQSDRAGHSTAFVDFALRALVESLSEVVGALRPVSEEAPERLERARAHFGKAWFSRKEYLLLQPAVSTATASRDLAHGVAGRQLVRQGTQRLARYRFET